MKKCIVILMTLTILFSGVPAHAATGENVQFVDYYMSWRNEYRLDYWAYPSSVRGVHVRFENAAGEVWTKEYGAEGLTGIYYLTCNGTYDYYFLDVSGHTVASITGIVTSAIVNGSCNSYPDGTIIDGLNVTATPNGDGTFKLDWNDIGASGYEIWKDGQLIDTVPTPPINVEPGSYIIRGVDPGGNTIAESDITIRPEDETGCGVCQNLSDLLDCPDWDRYMGELTGAIRAALPPPPDWEHIADLIGAAVIRHLQSYFGPVPDPPSQQEIDQATETPLPSVDISIPEAENLIPDVPGFDQPFHWDMETAPEIEIMDESKPFEIFDPLHNIDHDEPGVMVFPGDPRNHNGGIPNPETIPGAEPTPTLPDIPEIPNDPTPIPSDPGGIIPIPGLIDGEIPIPRG